MPTKHICVKMNEVILASNCGELLGLMTCVSFQITLLTYSLSQYLVSCIKGYENLNFEFVLCVVF